MAQIAAGPFGRSGIRRKVVFPKVPGCPGDGKRLTIKSDRGVVPVLGLDACAKELVAGIEPIAGSLTYVRRLAQVTDVDA